MLYTIDFFHGRVLSTARDTDDLVETRYYFISYLDDVIARYGSNINDYLKSDEIFNYIAPYTLIGRTSSNSVYEFSEFYYSLSEFSFDFTRLLEKRTNCDLSIYYDRLDEFVKSTELVKTQLKTPYRKKHIYVDVIDFDSGYADDVFYLFQLWLYVGLCEYYDNYKNTRSIKDKSTYEPYDLSFLFDPVIDSGAFNCSVILFFQRQCMNFYGYIPYFKQNMMNWLKACLDDNRTDDIINIGDLYKIRYMDYNNTDAIGLDFESLNPEKELFLKRFTNEKKYTYRNLLEHLKNYV